MPPEDKDKNSLYENLLRKGVSREQIERVYQDLRGKGYGEEEARKRSRASTSLRSFRATCACVYVSAVTL